MEFCCAAPDPLLEDETGGEAAHHVAQEAEAPHQVHRVDCHPGVAGQVGLPQTGQSDENPTNPTYRLPDQPTSGCYLSWSDHGGDQPVAELREP